LRALSRHLEGIPKNETSGETTTTEKPKEEPYVNYDDMGKDQIKPLPLPVFKDNLDYLEGEVMYMMASSSGQGMHG